MRVKVQNILCHFLQLFSQTSLISLLPSSLSYLYYPRYTLSLAGCRLGTWNAKLYLCNFLVLFCCFTLVEREIFGIFKDPQFAENPKSADQSDIQVVCWVVILSFCCCLLIHFNSFCVSGKALTLSMISSFIFFGNMTSSNLPLLVSRKYGTFKF